MEESSKKDEFEETVKKLEEKVGERPERKVSLQTLLFLKVVFPTLKKD